MKRTVFLKDIIFILLLIGFPIIAIELVGYWYIGFPLIILWGIWLVSLGKALREGDFILLLIGFPIIAIELVIYTKHED